MAPCRGFGGDLALFAAYPIKAKRAIVWRRIIKMHQGLKGDKRRVPGGQGSEREEESKF